MIYFEDGYPGSIGADVINGRIIIGTREAITDFSPEREANNIVEILTHETFHIVVFQLCDLDTAIRFDSIFAMHKHDNKIFCGEF